MSKTTAVLRAIRDELLYTAHHQSCRQTEEQGHAAGASGHGDSRNSLHSRVVRSCCQPLLSAALGRCHKILTVEQEHPAACRAGACIDGYELVGALYVAGGASGALSAVLDSESWSHNSQVTILLELLLTHA